MRPRGNDNRKQAQLCAQVAEIASLALGSSRDPRLNQLLVHSVTASADGARLIVNVVPTDIANFDSLELLVAALDAARPWLRSQIASEIYRKRTPDIRFQIVIGEENPQP
jgi:ribosome-binding factor A